MNPIHPIASHPSEHSSLLRKHVVFFSISEDIALADIAFEAQGDSAEELFRGATQALLETLADPTTVPASWKRQITKTEEDMATLLFEWLSEIVYWKDAAGVVFHVGASHVNM